MKIKNKLLRSTAAIIAALFALSFTGCGQSPITSESPSSTGAVQKALQAASRRLAIRWTAALLFTL